MKSYKLLYSIWSLPSLLYKLESVLYTLSVWVERGSPGLDEGWTSLGEFRGNKLCEDERETIGF